MQRSQFPRVNLGQTVFTISGCFGGGNELLEVSPSPIEAESFSSHWYLVQLPTALVGIACRSLVCASANCTPDVHHDKRTLLPMLIAGLALVIGGGVIIVSFV
ncbi:hypothetical protein SAZ10_21275 [Mesorhizobium sp. BAC0120]|uniref:hypothetical protein n=1 Tax=Mesorhizobium sp. BAC0120 TaxID=3090670 RepID=UPI00298D38EA|nr:hypothetical protein [Mesorhizobium sp. BAC0120]MDW6024286.1 hypothetical protein [Mesorhizobium sp. BAC0120]